MLAVVLARTDRVWTPHEISLRAPKKADVVSLTDGFTPDHRKGDTPKKLTATAPEISRKWLHRKTQIVPIEMIGPSLTLETFRDNDVVLLIDSEAAEASLVKGCSTKNFVELFWELSLVYRVNFFIDRV